MTTFYDLTATSITGQEIALSNYKDKVLLIVNTASHCGFTSQLKGLEELHLHYKDKGLVVLGFPCNQFGAQDPGSNEEIDQFCKQNYGVSFMMMQKINVNGDDAHPLFKWLKSQAPGLLGSESIKWNFTKFLVSTNAQTVQRFAPQDTPASMTTAIETLLSNSSSTEIDS